MMQLDLIQFTYGNALVSLEPDSGNSRMRSALRVHGVQDVGGCMPIALIKGRVYIMVIIIVKDHGLTRCTIISKLCIKITKNLFGAQVVIEVAMANARK